MSKFLSSKSFRIIFSLLVSFVMIAWIAKNVDLLQVWEEMKQVRAIGFIAVLAITYVQFYFRALRWRCLLPHQDGPYLTSTLFDGIMLGNFGNFILPLRAGEFIRPWMLSKFSGVKYPTALSSVVTERFFDLSMVLILFSITVFSLNDLSLGTIDVMGKTMSFQDIRGSLIVAAWGFSVLAFAVFLFIVVGSLYSAFAMRCLEVLLRPFPKKLSQFALSIANNFLAGTVVLKKPVTLFKVIAATVLIWLVTILGYWFGFQMFEGMLHMNMWSALILTVVLALGVAVPSAPGFLGVFEVACIISFAIVGEGGEQATVYAVVNHAIQYFIIVSWGVYVLLKYGIKLGDITQKKL